MPPKYSNNYRNSNNRNSHHHTPSTTTPITPTPSSGVPISNKSTTQTTTDPSRIIPQPRRRRSSVNREQQSSPSGDSETTSTNNANGSNNNHSTTAHHNNNTTSVQNIIDDDCENQAGLATNAMEKIFSTTLQFNADSILSAVDLLQQRREAQFPNEKRKRFSIREILEIGTKNTTCNDRHNDLPELDYRKLDWGITPLPTKTAELAKRPSRQLPGSNQNESPFGGKPFSGRGRSLSRENNALPFSNISNTSPATTTINSLNSRFAASSAIANSSSSTVMRTSGKGALWFDEPVIEESNPLELTNEEVERKKAFEEFRKIHHATVGSGSFFDFGAEDGESLESGLATNYDAEALEESLEPTMDEMGGSNASELENYFNTLSTGHHSTFGGVGASNFMTEASFYPKEQQLNEIEDEFISLPTPKSMIPPQKRDKPLFALDNTLNKEPAKPVHKEDPVISSVLQNKSGKSRFGFGEGLESDMKHDIQPQSQQPLPFTNNGGHSKFLNINNQPTGLNSEDQAILPIHHQAHAGGGATINVSALFGGSSSIPNRKQSNPIHHEAFNNFASTIIEKHPEEDHSINHNIHLEQFPVIDASNQISMMSAEDLELQFLKSLNDSNQPMPSMHESHIHEASQINQLFKPIPNEQNVGVQEVTSQQSTSQFVSPFQKYQEQKQNEKSETKVSEDLSLTPSKQSVSKTSTTSPASASQRKLSKTSANSPFVPSHLMKKMGTNTEKKIKLKVNTPVTNTTTATKSTNQQSNATVSTSAATNIASMPVQSSVETQQSPIINQQQMPIISQNEFLSQNNMAHLNPNLLPPNGNQPPVSPTMPMNMGMPISPLMNQNQPPMRMMQKPPTGFVPSQPYPNSPTTFIPFSPQGHPHPGIPAGFIPPNGNMFPNGFIPNNGMFPPHPNMFMGNQQQDFSQAMSLEDLEKELMNQK